MGVGWGFKKNPHWFRRTQEGSGGLGGENPAAFPQARPIFQQPFSLPCPNLGRDSILRCRKSAESFSSSVEIFAGIQSTTPFGDHPFSIKHPQDNFGLQNVNWHPPKCKFTPSKKGLATSNLQFLYRNTQKSPLDSLYFGGRQFAFWRLRLSWGGFIEKG